MRDSYAADSDYEFMEINGTWLYEGETVVGARLKFWPSYAGAMPIERIGALSADGAQLLLAAV